MSVSDTSTKICIFSLKSVGRLVRWSPLLSPKSPGFKPQTGLAKEEQKIKALPDDQKSESNFSRIQAGIYERNFGPEFCARF
jgi:hypothetical protein